MLGFHAAHAYPGRGWPREGLAEASGERASDSIIQCFFLGLFGMILSRTNDARVWLYVKLTSYTVWHDPRGSKGWAWHSNSGPLDFTAAGRGCGRYSSFPTLIYYDLVQLY